MKANDTKSETKGKSTNVDSVKNVAEVDLKISSETRKETVAAPVKETPKAITKEKEETAPVKKTPKADKETKKKTKKSPVKEVRKADTETKAKAETVAPAPVKEAIKADTKEKENKAPAKADAKTSTALAERKADKMFAVKTDEASYLFAPDNDVYNFGIGDFTVEAWVKTNQAGTLIARKTDDPGHNNGGFLMVVKDDGSIKLATDDGIGFYEVVSDKKSVLDDKWHHIMGVRQDGKLDIYLDFVKLDKTVQTNRFTPLDVNNGNKLTVAFTEQQGEVYQHLAGQLSDIRIWKIAKIYESKEKYNALKLKGSENGLVGWWSFKNKDGSDFSGTKNGLEASGNIEYVEKK